MNQVVQETERAAREEDPVICSCFKVKASTIRMAINAGGADSCEEVRELTDASSGCGACACRVERLLAGFPAQCGPCALCPACGHISKLCQCKCA